MNHELDKICEVVQICSEHDLGVCGPDDFEFIDMISKHASIPNHKPRQMVLRVVECDNHFDLVSTAKQRPLSLLLKLNTPYLLQHHL